jgi:hypothetical protein
MRRFQLRPLALGPAGFQQTLVIPPAPPRQAAPPAPDPGGDCDGVVELPELKLIMAYDSCAGANTWYTVLIGLGEPNPTAADVIFSTVDDELPGGYVLVFSDPPGPETLPESAIIERECDGTLTEVPAIYVGEYGC